jgi:DNA-binding transcriptional regulator YiaG
VENFAEQIKQARERLGLSQAAFARQWGIPKQTISAWETGFRSPHGLYREKLQHILGRIEKGAFAPRGH